MTSFRDTRKAVVKISPTARKAAGSTLIAASYQARPNRCGIVEDSTTNKPFSGEFVYYSAERSGTSKTGLYCASTLPFGLWESNRQRLTEAAHSNSELLEAIKAALQIMGWKNYLDVSRVYQVATLPVQQAKAMSKTRDPAKVNARDLLLKTRHTTDPAELESLLRAALAWVEDRQAYLATNVATAWESHIRWAETTLSFHTSTMLRICRKLNSHDQSDAVWFEISPLLDQITIKPWLFIKRYIRYINRRDIVVDPEPDIFQRLINAIVFEGAHTDLRHIAHLAETSETPDQISQTIQGLRARIDWLSSLDLPFGYTGPSDMPGLRERIITSLVRLQLRLQSQQDSRPASFSDLEAWQSAQAIDANQLRLDLRYRPEPQSRKAADNSTMWFG